MTSLPSRPLHVWYSSAANSLGPINGLFRIEVLPSLMVPQTLGFISEISTLPITHGNLIGFFLGARYSSQGESALRYWHPFNNSDELFAYDLYQLYDFVQELELHLDVNFTVVGISYLADFGAGPTKPILIAEREAIARGSGFEVEERSKARESLRVNGLQWTPKARVAHRYYSTGLSLLALEDQISGLLEAAFMQFYLSIEAILESYKPQAAIAKAKRTYGSRFTADLEAALYRVFDVRNNYIGHASGARRRGTLKPHETFAVAAQTLVARWVGRTLIELELRAPLLHREMRLYPSYNSSICFTGSTEQLTNEFALPTNAPTDS